MTLDYDTRKTAIGDFATWLTTVDEESQHENGVLFEAFVFRLMITRPTDTGELGERELEVAIARNARYEEVAGGLTIPQSFQRSMLGLSTNVFPASSDATFSLDMTRIQQRRGAEASHEQ